LKEHDAIGFGIYALPSEAFIELTGSALPPRPSFAPDLLLRRFAAGDSRYGDSR
jgi:hypothetical protein